MMELLVIYSDKGYWLKDGCSYTSDIEKAAVFRSDELDGFNLDGCELIRYSSFKDGEKRPYVPDGTIVYETSGWRNNDFSFKKELL